LPGLLRFGLGVAFALAIYFAWPIAARAADPWVFVNDVHYKPSADSRPSAIGTDTNDALLTSALAEMQRVSPHPPVVVMAGDFLGHHFASADAAPTMVALAKRFDAAFPQAQFVIALGNEDSDCGDFGAETDTPFLRTVADAWAPLVDLGGAAPNFVRTFAHDGFYTARLPIPGLRAVVVNNTFWSPFYRPWCSHHGDPTGQSLAELEGALSPSGTERRWVVMHIPPGIDAGTTAQLARGLAIVPFLRDAPQARFLALAGDATRRVATVITGHAHRFAYRIIGADGSAPVPVLIAPALSPIFGSLPAFLTAQVGGDGILSAVSEHSFVAGEWHDLGGWEPLGVSELRGSALMHLGRRLEVYRDDRTAFATLYAGPIRWNEINRENWPVYSCAASELDLVSFRACDVVGGIGWLTDRGARDAGVVASASVCIAILAAWLRRYRQRTQR
jgi:sphingomyelin phosphodiesterase acid-like 3